MTANDIIIDEVLKVENRSFWFRILACSIGYFAMSLWLNSIRTTASLWLVWLLIIIQFILYFSIFITSYFRSKVFGLNNNIALILFTALAVLGRVENWEIIIIPLLVVTMLVLSGINKKISTEAQERFLKNE
ncbi:MAG: hypothetical protein KBB23_07600 [Smithella sp.]|jgi:hypothetical protein|nr:hypothetical protein [Smithella sp.]